MFYTIKRAVRFAMAMAAISGANALADDSPLAAEAIIKSPAPAIPNPTKPPAGGVGGMLGHSPNAPLPEGLTPNLSVLSVQLVNSNNVALVPIPAGEPFWIRVQFQYDNPTCDLYQIGRTVNGPIQQLAPEIDWGCGFSGSTNWVHIWGGWVLHNEGVYSATIELDATDAIAESNESDNTGNLSIVVTGGQTDQWEIVQADLGRAALSEGTDVIVGTMDDALDYLHPWLDGLDSLGRPRLIAANQNSMGVDGGPINAGHATAVMGVVLARGLNGGDITGLAPDARYVSAEFINRASIPGLQVLDVREAAGFLVDHDVDVINMSWSWWAGSNTSSQSGEGSITNLMADYLSYGLNIVCVPAVNQLGFPTPTAPGAARNVITVGGLDQSLTRVWEPQDDGPTLDGRAKPELVGNDSADAVAPTSFWRDGFLAVSGFGGTSFAAPFVTGAAAQMIGYAKEHGVSRDHRVIKAIITNSGDPVLRVDGSPWIGNTMAGLDNEQGTGLLSIARIVDMYVAGEQEAGNVTFPGFDLNSIQGSVADGAGMGIAEYAFGRLLEPAEIRITLATSRPTFWNDGNGNGTIDESDFFFTSSDAPMEQFELDLFRDDVLVLSSTSVIDSVKHVRLAQAMPGRYVLRVNRVGQPGIGAESEPYALAWWSDGQFAGLGDLNGDGVVNGTDLAILLSVWNTSGSGTGADLNGDGMVNGADLAALLSVWN